MWLNLYTRLVHFFYIHKSIKIHQRTKIWKSRFLLENLTFSKIFFSEYFQFLDGDNFFSLIAILNPSEMMLIYTADIILKQTWAGLLIGNPCDKWSRKFLIPALFLYRCITPYHKNTPKDENLKIKIFHWKIDFFNFVFCWKHHKYIS